ncbi:hypothetical protein SLS64_002827 [Diaporthe eres]|uniref:DUF5672 domain-containing protein n=1 Tax=Diaporthe eres TaxID=83184 RepID=A0ABR1PLK3_DIAER
MIKAQLNSRLEEARQRIPSIKVDWTPTDDPRAAYNASKVAMIIEPRVMPHLVPQLLHMIAVVPPDWRFLFIGSDKSVTLLGRSASVKHQQVVGKLDLMVLPEPWDISSKEMVYRTLTDMRFYDEFLPGVEWILKFEYDSILCANSEVGLNEWLDWHWTGAPRGETDRFAGNGGLSLRRVTAIRQVLGFQARYNDTVPEDEWFGSRLYIMPGLKVASGVEGALAVEDVYMERPMGFHVREMGDNLAPEVWEDHERRKKMLEYCPELHTVLKAKLDRERCAGDSKDGVIHPTPEEKEEERLKQQAEQEARRKAQEAALKKLQDERKKQEVQEAEDAKKKKEEEEAKKKKEEEAKKKHEEEAAKQKEEEAAKKLAAPPLGANEASQPNQPNQPGQNNPNEPATPPVPKPEAPKAEVPAAAERPEQPPADKEAAPDRQGLAHDVPLDATAADQPAVPGEETPPTEGQEPPEPLG